MKNAKGFTLVELMVVVVIIGILSAIAMPAYNTYVKQTGRSDAFAALTKIVDRQERFYLQNGTYTTSFAAAGLNMDTTSEEGFYTLSVTSAAPTTSYVATATAVTGKQQENDTGCTVLTLSSTGAKTPTDCW